MQLERKHQIKEALLDYVGKYDSQNKAANSLNKVSSATITQVLKGNWDEISDEMWRRIAKQIGVDDVWQFVETANTSKKIASYLEDAQRYTNVHAIVHREGGSKSATVKNYAKRNANAWYIACSEYFNRKTFLSKILQAMLRDNSGTVSDMMHNIVTYIEGCDKPVLFIDEADKLSDQVLSFFITFSNELEDKCAIVLLGTNFLEKRIDKGVKLNRRGYKEIYSRIGRRFIEIAITPAQLKEDIKAICIANGISDALTITEITNKCDGDFRRVKKLVHAKKQMQKS
ncbi:MAG: AAA family ATPase [Flavipsychrobacter sp.]